MFLLLHIRIYLNILFFFSYIDRFIGPGDEISDECRMHLLTKPVFLPRSIRSFNKRSEARQNAKLRTAEKAKPEQQKDPAGNDVLSRVGGDAASATNDRYFNYKLFFSLYLYSMQQVSEI